MAGVNTWVIRCDAPGGGVQPGQFVQNQLANGWGGNWALVPSGQAPTGPLFEVFLIDLGNGNVAFQYSSGAVTAYASVWGCLTDYLWGLSFGDWNGWITTVGPNETFVARPTGDGLFAIYAPSTGCYVQISDMDGTITNGLTTQGSSGNIGAAARFTALGQSRPAVIDFVEVMRDASAMSFAGVDLTEVPLSGCNLSECNFNGVNLADANFTGSNLAGADLRGANLAGTNLSGFDLSTFKLSAPLIQSKNPDIPTVLADCTLPYALIGLDWSCLDLTGAAITGLPTSLAGLNALGARVAGRSFQDCNLDGANFAQATLDSVDFTGASLRNKPVFDGAVMPGAVFTRAKLDGASFVGAALGGVAQISAAEFSFAYVSNCDFSQANLFGVSFAGASLVGGNTLSGAANLQETDFSNAYMANADLTGAVLLGAKFDGAFMVECVLTGANLSPAQDGSVPASLTSACLQAAAFQGANLSGADLTNAAITDAEGSIPVQYYDETGKLTPSFPMPFPAGSFPAASSLDASTTCPNGSPYSVNVNNGLSLAQMMAATDPPTSWSPANQATAPKSRALASAR